MILPNVNQNFKEHTISILYELSQTMRKEEMLPKSFGKMCITLIIKPVISITYKEQNIAYSTFPSGCFCMIHPLVPPAIFKWY